MATAKKRSASKPKLAGASFAFFGEFRAWPSYHPGTPAEVAAKLGATVHDAVTADLDYVVFGDRRGPGRAEAKKLAERLAAKSKGKAKKPAILDEAAYREMVRADIRGKRFAFVGGFDFAPSGHEDGLLQTMVEDQGGVLVADVDGDLDYLVVGNRRGEGKQKAINRAEKLREEGHPLQTIGEEAFLELVRSDKPVAAGENMEFASFFGRLTGVVDQGKLGRAMKMLKGESFKLYVQVEDERLVGVVRSQTGSGVYASWLAEGGRYGCTTQEMDECMGLQGSPCKHLLVLLIGITRAGELGPDRALAWIQGAARKGPSRDNEVATQTFLRYGAAQSGEIDWRPTETIPEDFYAF